MSNIRSLRRNKAVSKIVLILLGNIFYAMGVNLAINPLHFYSGGFTGIAQLLRLFLLQVLHVPQIAGLDYLGIIYFLINVPFFIMAYRVMGKRFCLETLVSIVVASAFLSIIPVPKTPIIEDHLLAAMVGGLGSGIGAGMVLRAGSSQGGQDLIGVCLAKTHPDFKVGNIGIIISICIYAICLFIYDVPTVLYSIIFAVVTGVCIDRVHTQNIKLEAMIFTKKEGMAHAIMTELRRGVTNWEGAGAYTKEDSHVLVTVISKYEEPLLKEIVAKYDPHAFVILVDHARVIGNFEKRFTE
jgi:uncharacterized membrane-anchored protein YitT (DUF2179 family)